MSESTQKILRKCRKCKSMIESTAKEIKAHARTCSG
jgi:hypothetical protein